MDVNGFRPISRDIFFTLFTLKDRGIECLGTNSPQPKLAFATLATSHPLALTVQPTFIQSQNKLLGVNSAGCQVRSTLEPAARKTPIV